MLKIMVMLLLAAGTVMWLYSLHLPYYTDEEIKEKLDNGIDLTQADWKTVNDYFIEVDNLKTPKTMLEDAGSGIVVFSLLLLAVFFVRRIDSFADIKKIGGLNKMPLIVISLIMCLLLLPGTWWYDWKNSVRGDYKFLGDSILIYIVGTCVLFFSLLIILPVLTLRYRAAHSVFIRAKAYTVATVLTEIFYGMLLIFTALFTGAAVVEGDHVAIIVAMYFFYLFLALRSGWLAATDNVRSENNLKNHNTLR